MGLEAALIGLTVVSGVTSAIGAFQQGKAMQRAEEYNAAVAKQSAEIAQQNAAIETARKSKEAARYRARQEALYAKAGVMITGSPLYVLADTATEFEFEKEIIKYNANITSSRALSEASYHEFLGDTYYQEGLFKAGQTLLGTGLSLGQNYLYSRIPSKSSVGEN